MIITFNEAEALYRAPFLEELSRVQMAKINRKTNTELQDRAEEVRYLRELEGNSCGAERLLEGVWAATGLYG